MRRRDTFLFLLAGATIVAIYTIRRLRALQAAAALNSRWEDRLTERNCLAGELQDTFLQSVQASKMLADQARYDETVDEADLRQTVGKLSEWLEQAVSEGQAALNALRSSAGPGGDLAEAFQRVAEISRPASSKGFELALEGAVRGVHPLVRERVYLIGSEFIRSAFLRSKGTLVEVRMLYGRDLSLRMREDTVAEFHSIPFHSIPFDDSIR